MTKYTKEQAVELLKHHYPDRLTLSDVSETCDNGDGSASVRYDLIRLSDNKLLKASEQYDSENHGGDVDYDSEYAQLTTWGDNADGVSVDTLIDAVLKEI